jgi:NAD(P)H dehydrogenase (quinone)
MYAITGITGQVGGAVARTLLAKGEPIRAVVRGAAKGEAFAKLGADVALADFHDAAALERAFTGVDGVFVMLPPSFAPSKGFPEMRAIVEAMSRALVAAAPPQIVCLSTIGAHRSERLGLLEQLHVLEEEIGSLGLPVAFVRAAWFLENTQWDVEPARRTGQLDSFLQPLDREVPMVATADVGRVAAETLLERWAGRRVLEVEGPRRYSPDAIAASLGEALGRSVVARAVPRSAWAAIFEGQGTPWPEPRMEMLDGFNSGWIDFEGRGAEHRIGAVPLEEVLGELVQR